MRIELIRVSNTKHQYHIVFPSGVLDAIKHMDQEVLPRNLPMLCEPKPWQSFDGSGEPDGEAETTAEAEVTVEADAAVEPDGEAEAKTKAEAEQYREGPRDSTKAPRRLFLPHGGYLYNKHGERGTGRADLVSLVWPDTLFS